MRRLNHTIALILVDDGPGVVQVRELFAVHLSRRVLFALVINLAALLWLTHDLAASVAQTWDEGIFVLVRWFFPLRFSYSYVPG